MGNFYVWVFLFLSLGILVSHLGQFQLSFLVPTVVILFSFLLIGSNFFILFFLASIFLVGISINNYNKLEDRFYRNSFVGCSVNSVPYVSSRFTAFRCHVLQTDKKEILHKTVNVYLKGENREVFLGSSVYFLGKVNIYNNNIKTYPYRHFFQIDNSKNPFYLIYWLKNKLIERYREHSYREENFRMGLALIFGEKGYLGKEREDFINAGTSHLLAISGMHVGIILLTMLFIFRFNRKFSYYLSLGFLSVYPLFTGLHIPVVRASLLGTLYIISKLKYLKINPLNLLFFVGFVVLLFSPNSLFSVSFQLSFIAVLGLILYSNLLNVQHQNPAIRYIGSSVLMSVVAVLFTTPIILYYFGKFSLTTIIATPVLVLLLFPYLFLSVFNLFSFFSFSPTVHLMDFLGGLFIKINSFFAHWEFIHQGFSPSIFSVVIYIILLIAVAVVKISNLYKLFISTVVFFMFLNLSKSSSKQWEIQTFKGKRYPHFVVISPYGECFFKGFSRKLKIVMDKKGCRKRFLVNYYDIYDSINQVEFSKGVVSINGVKYKLENKDYIFYPVPEK